MVRRLYAFVFVLSIGLGFSTTARTEPVDNLYQNLSNLSLWKYETEGLAISSKHANKAAGRAAAIQYRGVQQSANSLLNKIADDIRTKQNLSEETYRESLARYQQQFEDFRTVVASQPKATVYDSKKVDFVTPLLAVLEDLRQIASTDSKVPEVTRKALHGLRLRDFEKI